MSNAGQAALTIVGGVVGFYFGGPTGAMYGASLGGMVGSAAFPTDLGTVRGPRLDDMRVQTSTIGAPIPIIYGTYAVAGNVIWSSGIIETTRRTRQGGKGGPTQTVKTYTYSVNCAVGVCEGPIGGIRRIWADAELIYDARPQQPDEGTDTYNDRLVANAALMAATTVYLGTNDQLPDPTIESWEGVENVSGFRDLAYVVFTEFQLANYGNRVPNFRFEVQSLTSDCVSSQELSTEVLYPWSLGDYPVSDGNTYTITVESDGTRSLPGTYATVIDAASAIATSRGKPFGTYQGYSTRDALNGLEDTNRQGGPEAIDTDPIEVFLHYNFQTAETHVAGYQLPCTMISDLGAQTGTLIHSRGMHAGDSGFALYLVQNLGSTTAYSYDTRVACSANTISIRWDGIVKVRRTPGPPSGDDWQVVSGSYRVLQEYDFGGSPSVVTAYPLNPTLAFGDANYSDETFWTAAYDAAVTAGTMQAGLTYGVDYPVFVDSAYARTSETCTGDPGQITLGEIVADLCLRSGLKSTQYDVSELTEIVEGYAIGRPMTARDAISPLRSFGWFDCQESAGVLKWPLRGRGIVAELAYDDLAAHPAGEQRPTAIDIRRAQDVELPRVVRVHFAQSEKNYEAGEQSASRTAVGEIHRQDLELTVAMVADKAAKIAEVILYDRWISRTSYEFSVDASWLKLEPCDVITAPIDGRQERLRIVAIDHALPTLLRISAVRDDDGVYTSYAVGSPNSRSYAPGQSITVAADTVSVELLNLPLLLDEQDDAGYYAAVISPGAVTFPGATIFRSADGGVTYTEVGIATDFATVGNVISTLPEGPTTIVDYENTLSISLDYGDLESVSFESLLSGANAAAIGQDGRWEIIQFLNAVQTGESPETWELSGLLRGRRGTDHAIGQSVAGDRFVLLDSAIVRLPMNSSGIGALRRHRAVISGGRVADAPTVDFVPAGTSLLPFSVVHVSGERNMDGDLTISFIRRGRIGQELRDGRDIALSETSESYEIDILVGQSDDTVLRTLSGTGQSIVYAAEDIVTDFGSPPPESIRVRIYQMSSEIGRGYPTESNL